jgi:hypothetical protein
VPAGRRVRKDRIRFVSARGKRKEKSWEGDGMPGWTRSSMPCRDGGGARNFCTGLRGRGGLVVAVSFKARGRGACAVLWSVRSRRAVWLVMTLQFRHSTFFYLLYESAAA